MNKKNTTANNMYNLLLNPRILTKHSRILYLSFIYYIYCFKNATNHTQTVSSNRKNRIQEYVQFELF